ncbi:DUF4249 family protein [Reichenbachiella versicolor]|uniref:DUF4249 family protein n=1 Tax=Reichenbachiella versicolor TaxID=1821036 RepID=UPI0013A5923A|nr:DUF4249 family protein [Reichenbachiella versicolor]
MKNLWLIFILLMLIQVSCIDTVDLELSEGEREIFIDGWLTDESDSQKVQISWTNGFLDESGYEGVTGAEVYVVNQSDQRIKFKESSPGMYESLPEGFTPKLGEEYILKVTWEDYEVQSNPIRLVANSELITTSVVSFADLNQVDISSEENNWYVRGVIDDNPRSNNFYVWRLIVDGEPRVEPSDIVLFDDKFTNGNLFAFDASNVLFRRDASIKLIHASLDKEAYDYLTQLKKITTNNSISPSSPPSELVGNLKDVRTGKRILGYFGASSVIEIAVQ